MKLTLNDLSNLSNPTAAVANINQNNEKIELAFENTISRDGTSPNQMNSQFDMNSNRIVNLPDALNSQEPATYSQLNEAIESLESGVVLQASYVTANPNGTLTNERVLAGSGAIAVTDNGPNNNILVSITDPELNALSSTTSAADQVPYYTGVGTASTTPLTSYARSLLDDNNAATARSTLGVSIGSNVQAWDADLDGVASLTGGGYVAKTGSGTFATRSINGTSNEIAVTNTDGVGGSSVLSLPSSLTLTGKTITGGTFSSTTLTSPSITTPTGIVKGNVGLGNVDNTSDVNKPVSTLQQTALNLKADLASPVFTGVPSVPTAANGTNTTQAASTAFVIANAASAGVSFLNGQTGSVLLGVIPQGRLTHQSGFPVPSSSVSNGNVVYYTPYNGNQLPIYDGTKMVPTSFSELSQLTTDTSKSPAAAVANTIYDIFVWNDSGTIRATRGPAWANSGLGSASRGTGAGTSEHATINGVLVNGNNITNGPIVGRGTYVGSIRTNASSLLDVSFGGSASGGVAGNLNIWNMYNRINCCLTSVDTGASYAYTTNGTRQARASSGNQVGGLIGYREDAVTVSYSMRIDPSSVSGAYGWLSLGKNTITAFSIPRYFQRTTGSIANYGSPLALLTETPSLGYSYYAAVESGDGANSSTFNTDSNGTLNMTIWW